MEGLQFPNGRGLNAMIGEIGGSAEWAVGVLPLVWRGGQAIGMLTSQSALTRKDLTPEGFWKERFHFTEDEFMQIQDARFERKPYFTIDDILDDPYAGGISAFGAITDNYFIPFMEGVKADKSTNRINVNVLVVNSLGMVECWQMVFGCEKGIEHTTARMNSPKVDFVDRKGDDLEKSIGSWLDDEHRRERFRIFFQNEYYPALIPVQGRMVMLHHAVDGLVERGALDDRDRQIIRTTEKLAASWFSNSQ
jgi:hypothetical protein